MPIHKQILTANQLDLLPLIKKFSNHFYLVGGTALALQYGHRRSIDFDLFTQDSFDNQKVIQTIRRHYKINQIRVNESNHLTLVAHQIQITFHRYSYPIKHTVKFEDIITMPDPLAIATMKAFALGQRAKWKDYVDLYFVFKNHSLKEITKQAHKYYSEGEFDQKLFRVQLAYHQDIRYFEPIEYMPGFKIDDKIIKQKLTKISLS